MNIYSEKGQRRLQKARVFLFEKKVRRRGCAVISGQEVKIFSIVGGSVIFNYKRNPMPTPKGQGLQTGIENLDGYPDKEEQDEQKP